jgi:hypothetical protein
MLTNYFFAWFLQDELTRKIRLMSGYREEDYTLRVTHVVAGNILSEKCAAAFCRKIPVMTKDWIEAVWKDSQVELVHATDVKYALHACPLFYKLTIGVSQSNELKETVRKLMN